MTEKKPPVELEMAWEGGMRFAATDSRGVGSTLDGDGRAGFSPMKALLASLCACMGIDLVMIVEKMRAELEGLEVDAQGLRNQEPPRYFRKIHLDVRMKGDIPQAKAERAVDLSLEKYCSVFQTMRNDIEVTREVTVNG